jgi:chromosome segregation ATPase
MTASKEKTFMDWLFGSSLLPEAEHLQKARERIEQMQRALEEQRARHGEACEALRQSSENQARLAQRQTELELELSRINQELVDAKASSDTARGEVARLTRAAVESRTTGLRDAEARRKLSIHCSTLQLEVDRLRSLLEALSKRESDLDQALQHQRSAREAAEAANAVQHRELLRHEELVQALEQAAARARDELAAASARGQALEAHQAALEQKQKELLAARAEAARLRLESERQRKAFEQAKLLQQEAVEAERRAWAGWLGDVWSALLHSVGSAAPLALEAACNKLEPVARAATTEAAEARLRELVSAKSLCRNLTIHEKPHELRLELELGPALEGTAAGWLGILATRYLAAMLDRPLHTGELELTDSGLAVHALRWHSGAGTEPRAG